MMRMRWAGRIMDPELGGGDTGLDHLFGRHFPAVDAKTAERGLQLAERQARIEQRAENHVAGRAGEAVEVKDVH
jgi:hypothetical protein